MHRSERGKLLLELSLPDLVAISAAPFTEAFSTASHETRKQKLLEPYPNLIQKQNVTEA